MVQIFAWCRMTAEHSRTMPLSEAVATTFDGEMCCICRMVAAAKKQQQSPQNIPETKLDGNVLLYCEARAPVVIAHYRERFGLPGDSALPEDIRVAPSTPPPRLAAA
jgi:hypothetical protein